MSRPLRATYRLQLGPHLDLAGARALVPYLERLGVSHLYLSPVLQARPGSPHGYDQVDPGRVSEELGGEAALRELAAAAPGIVLDIVPNHMAASDENPLWADPRLRRVVFDIDPATGRHRRFFDIDHLAGVRQEDPEVFERTHALALRLVEEGVVHGLRVDHVDGLADPGGYLGRLASRGVERIWVEKILERDERLPDWPVRGTTGYEVLAAATGLFVDPAGEEPLTALHTELSGDPRPFAAVAAEAKLEQARGALRPEVERLRSLLDEPAMDEAVSALPVYRTYIDPARATVSEQDRRTIEAAPLPERLRRILLLGERGHDELVRRFEQTTGAVMAKGVEDTAFYRYARLPALCEVGGDPGRFGHSPAEVHALLAERAARFPEGLSATQTHDAKRSPDARARLAALAGIAERWCERVRSWRRANAGLGAAERPTPAEEHVAYQALVGAWPISAERLRTHITKVLREAKLTTSWTEPDEAHERGVLAFCDALLRSPRFLAELEEVVAWVEPAATVAALGAVLLKVAAPGVPDLYQGDETWDRSLVDPDNRRRVDWAARGALLERVERGGPPEPAAAKLALVARGLDLRRRRPEAFAGPYTPLAADEGALAFLRGETVIAAAAARPAGAGAAVALPGPLRGRWRHVVTGAELELGGEASLAGLCGGFPVVLLERA